jgi:hypothetical protein
LEEENNMSSKVCPKCNEVNLGSALVCAICGATLPPSKTMEEEQLESQKNKESGSTVGLFEDMKKDIRKWAIGLFVLGIILILLYGIVGVILGLGLIVLGIINFRISRRVMFIVNSIALIIVGLFRMLIIFTLSSDETVTGVWGCTLGLFLVGYGCMQMLKYYEYRTVNESKYS